MFDIKNKYDLDVYILWILANALGENQLNYAVMVASQTGGSVNRTNLLLLLERCNQLESE